MALTNLIVEVNSENVLEEAACRIEGRRFLLTRTSEMSWAGELEVDVVGLVQYSVVLGADTGAKWTIDSISGLVELP